MPTTTGASGNWHWRWGAATWRRSSSGADRTGAISSTLSSGYARPRLTNGDWVTPFDPYLTPGFVESDAWQYTWFVPQDVPGLIDAMGRDRFVKQLNDGFEKSAPQRFNGGGRSAVYHGNEPSMHMAWLFNWAGKPWLTQKWVRAILNRYYGYTPNDFYLGDEDQGQMSSWFVMAALGLFEMDGGCRVHPGL